MHSELADENEPLTAEEGDAVLRVSYWQTDGQDLDGLSLSELSYISDSLEKTIPSGLPLYNAASGVGLVQEKRDSLIHLLETAQSVDGMQVRQGKSRHTPLDINSNDIHHVTTLFVKLHSNLKTISENNSEFQPSVEQFNNTLNTIFMTAANNHIQPAELEGQVRELITDSRLSDETAGLLVQQMESDISHFKPTNNLGRQVESPHAKKMENIFAAMVLKRPPKAMQDVGCKMATQLQERAPEYFKQILKKYINLESHYAYPVANIASMTKKELRGHIENGTNLAVVMDFNHFVGDDFSKNAALDRHVGMELAYTEHAKTYAQDVSERRGERVPLPRLKAKDLRQSAIGVGTDTSAIHLKHMKNPVIRPSTIKTAFGAHAQESAKADVAQACGTTGRGNLHLWGQSLINQAAVPHNKMSENDTRVFLAMVATVMTADGGHTLSETLETTHIASRNAEGMTPRAQERVSDLFGHMKNITEPMKQESTRFRHFDMVFNSVPDPDLHQYLASAWEQTMAQPPEQTQKGASDKFMRFLR